MPTSAPAKKSARKTAAKKAPAAKDPVIPITTEAAISEPTPNGSPPPVKKAAARKAPAKKALALLIESQPQIFPLIPSPAAEASAPKKLPAKKTSAKAVVQKSAEPVLEIPAPVLEITSPTLEAKVPSPRKTAAKKTARTPSKNSSTLLGTEAPFPASQPPAPHHPPEETQSAHSPPTSDYHPDQNRFETPPAGQPVPAPAPDATTSNDAGLPPYAKKPRTYSRAPRPGTTAPSNSPSDLSPAPVAAEDASPPSHRYPQLNPDDPRQAPAPQNMELGPDGQPRRLTKWERWKLRKEKFKQQKQQRYLERTGRLPAPVPNGETTSPEAEPGTREPREPRPDNRGEPRAWEPRPPRPVIPPGPPEPCEGLLEMTDKGFAFLRPRDRGFVPSPTDPFVSAELLRQHGLREAVWVEGIMQRGGRGPQVMELRKVNGLDPSAYRTLPLFEELTAINPNKRYILETDPKRHTTRLIDFISPIGRGQRGLIVAPPRAGKTTFLQHIAEAVLHNYTDVKVIVLLVDERPEEVTEIARALPGAEIMASSNDQDPRNHIRMANLAIERAKRLVEAGQHVFMLLDSITRLARGFNNSMRGGSGGKAMSGGLDSRSLEAPRRLFAAARNTREAGSLTIMATALVETNNKGDDLIFQEFKGTGNMELVLDRKISQAYVYPAVDIFKSGTRREELLLPAHQLEKVHLIRRGLSGHRPQEAVERLLQVMGKYNNNNQMLIEIKARGE